MPHKIARQLAWVVAAVVVAYAVWTLVLSDQSVVAIVLLALAVLAVVTAAVTTGRGLFANVYPNVLVSSTDAAYNLTVQNTASGSYALTVMTIVAVVFFPLVLANQIWTYVVFRRRVRSRPPPAPSPPVAP